MYIREAILPDITGIQNVRNNVRENKLSDPKLVTDADVEDYIVRRGKGWVCEIDNRIVGFAIVSIMDNNVWALFTLPQYERIGIGRKLHDEMINWYFSITNLDIWLSTDPGTRAELFYRIAGWIEKGSTGKGEIKFEMTKKNWLERSNLM